MILVAEQTVTGRRRRVGQAAPVAIVFDALFCGRAGACAPCVTLETWP